MLSVATCSWRHATLHLCASDASAGVGGCNLYFSSGKGVHILKVNWERMGKGVKRNKIRIRSKMSTLEMIINNKTIANVEKYCRCKKQ